MREVFQTEIKPKSSDRTFGLVMATVCLLVAFVPCWNGHPPRWFWVAPGAGFASFALLLPLSLRPLHLAWLRFGLVMQMIVSPFVLGLIYFGLFFPLGLWVRWRQDPLARRFDPAAASYWIVRDPATNPDPADRMPEQF